MQYYPSSNLATINPEITINSGQLFLWEKYKDSWFGIHANNILKISFHNDRYDYSSYPEQKGWEKTIFRMDESLSDIYATFPADRYLREAMLKYPGLRITRQDPFQCIISFVCASNTNIARIRLMLSNLCRKFGKKIEFDGREFFTFPTPIALARASIDELNSCGLGYRSRAVKAVAEKIVLGYDINNLALPSTSYEKAKNELLQIYGIGNKVADCILLFSLDKTEAFPIDIWIARSLYSRYRWLFESFEGISKKTQDNFSIQPKLSPKQYQVISKLLRSHFGKFAGYAQQYLYYDIRHTAGKKW